MQNYILNSNAGNTFDSVSLKAKSIATEKEVIVEFDFNGIKCLVSKSTDLKLLWRDYANAHLMEWKEVGHDCMKIYSSEIETELNKRTKEQEEKQKFHTKVVGVEIELKDKESWDIFKEKNKDPYGACCVEYAEGWARLMQVELSKGVKLIDCAEKTSFELGFLGITGFMYGCAVSMLSKCWKHGEELRKWHNKEYNHEGDGVVNPAILTIPT